MRNDSMASRIVSAERIRELLEYDPSTGLFTWKVSTSNRVKVGDIAGTLSYGYVAIGIDGKPRLAHRLAWMLFYGEWPACDIDHINGVRHDNRIENLRAVTRSVNMQNQRRGRGGNAGGLLGATRYHRSKSKWLAQIKDSSGRLHYLGIFPTAEEAHAAYVTAKRQMHQGCAI